MIRDEKYKVLMTGNPDMPISINGKPVSLPKAIAARLSRRQSIHTGNIRDVAISMFCPMAPALPDNHKGDVRYYKHAGKEQLTQHIFGMLLQSQMLLDDFGMKMNIQPKSAEVKISRNAEGKPQEHVSDTFEITLINSRGKSMTIPFSAGVGNRVTEYDKVSPFSRVSVYDCQQAEATARVVSPLPLEILDCIASDDFQNLTFEDWCDEYGFDSDSRSAYKTYETCRDQTLQFKTLFPDVDLYEYKPLLIHRGDEVEEDRSDLSPEERWAGYLDYLREWDALMASPSGYDEWLGGDDGRDDLNGALPDGEEEEKQANAYIEYLSTWADDHADPAFLGCSPAGYGEFLDCEYKVLTQGAKP